MGFCGVAMWLWTRFQVEMLACRTPRQVQDTETSVLIDFERLGLLGSAMDSGCLCVWVLFVLFLPPCWLWGLAERQGIENVGKQG